MNAVAEAIQSYMGSFEALQSAQVSQTPDWLVALRRNAFAQFAKRGFPAERHEDWKYSNTRALQKLRFSPTAQRAPNIEDQAIAPVLLQAANTQRLVFVDGASTPKLSSSNATTKGLRITPLNDALYADDSRIKDLLLPPRSWNEDPFMALNTAFLANGALIEVADDVHIAEPVQLVFVSAPQNEATASHPRVIVKLGARAHLTLIESHFGLDRAANFTNSCTQIALDEESQLDYLTIQHEADSDFHVSRIYVAQQERSRFTAHTYNLGGQWVRNDLRVRLEAPGAHVQLDGLYLADQRRHVDNHTRIDHLAPHTTSDELYRGIIRGRGRAVFNGKVVVSENAVKTDTIQINNNLLLTRQGEIDTKPELEIYADDVKCSHGATIGQLDEQSLFYLRSRGIDVETAREILTSAFARVVTERIADPKLRRFALTQLTAALPQVAGEELA